MTDTGRPQLNSLDPADRAIAAAVTGYTEQLARQLDTVGYWPARLHFWQPRDRFEEIGFGAFLAKLEHTMKTCRVKLWQRAPFAELPNSTPAESDIEAAYNAYAANLATQLRGLRYWPLVLKLPAPRTKAETMALNMFVARLDGVMKTQHTPIHLTQRPNDAGGRYRRRWST